MPPDFPAAHSMDTSWYAVDPAGRVALFESGSIGNVPVGAEDQSVLNDLFRARHPEVPAGQRQATEDLAEEFGFYLYHYDNALEVICAYSRRITPANPVHVDQLPPGMRSACKEVRVPVLFAQAERVQPLEFAACHYWASGEWDAYLAADGVTVRPIPGREGRFPDFVRQFKIDYPEEAARFRFEGVDDGR